MLPRISCNPAYCTHHHFGSVVGQYQFSGRARFTCPPQSANPARLWSVTVDCTGSIQDRWQLEPSVNRHHPVLLEIMKDLVKPKNLSAVIFASGKRERN